MDSESPLPAKRQRASLNPNVQLTECVREFKLPRQFPSMVTKASSDAINEKNKLRQHLNTSAVTSLSKTKIATNPEFPGASLMRKIKIKGKDGRDLGELNVQDWPKNIQGKTITLAKNGIVAPPETVSPTGKSKGMTVNVLTPVNILKPENFSSNNLSSLPFVNKDHKKSADVERDCRRPIILNRKKIDNGKKPVIIEQKQMSAVMDTEGRPQVLVFQSGKNWHLVKLATTAPPSNTQNGKNIVLEKLASAPNGEKNTILQAKEQSQTFVVTDTSQNTSDKLLVTNRISSKNNSNTLTKNATERYKSKSPIAVTENGEMKPKMEISRVFVTANNKSVSQKSTTSQIHIVDGPLLDNTISSKSLGQSPRNNSNLHKDVMVVLPSDIPGSLESDLEIPSVKKHGQSANSNSNEFLKKFSKDSDIAKDSGIRDHFLEKKEKKKSGEGEKKNEKITNRLDILTKALSTVEDKELRAKALKALADCGIGMEKLVPICPPSEMRPVKDSDTQTPVFGIIEPEHFVHVTPENPVVQRIRPIERKSSKKIGHIIGNPHPQELLLNTFDLPDLVTPNACDELDAMVARFVGDNEGVDEVKNILADKPSQVSFNLVSQLIEDFQTYKTFDENGLLSLHRAVLNDDLRAVSRLLTLFRKENPDALTSDGQTSLELAVRYEVSVKIVKLLLDAGAEPTSTEIGHDSALLIASKKSLPTLKELIPYVKTRKYLDYYDSSGFAALHYCAQNNNITGVIELLNASADVNIQDRRSGRTPLFHAIESEHIELAQLLLDRGAQAHIGSYSGHTVFALVEEGKHYSLTESLNRIGK